MHARNRERRQGDDQTTVERRCAPGRKRPRSHSKDAPPQNSSARFPGLRASKFPLVKFPHKGEGIIYSRAADGSGWLGELARGQIAQRRSKGRGVDRAERASAERSVSLGCSRDRRASRGEHRGAGRKPFGAARMSIARPSAEAATILRRRAGYARYRVRPDGRGRAGSQVPVGEARAIPLRRFASCDASPSSRKDVQGSFARTRLRREFLSATACYALARPSNGITETRIISHNCWRTRRDSNPWPLPSESSSLALRGFWSGRDTALGRSGLQ
jgi:hypothetical protein